jgi:hypothetical protein
VNFFPNYSRTSSRTVRFGSVRKCISSSSVRFEDFQKSRSLALSLSLSLYLSFDCRPMSSLHLQSVTRGSKVGQEINEVSRPGRTGQSADGHSRFLADGQK